MGVIKKIIFILALTCVSNLIAQVKYDTIYFSGNKFIEHIVKGGESLRSIAGLHKVTTQEIKDANELERRLYYNQVLYIPISSEEKEKSLMFRNQLVSKQVDIDTSVIHIALLMPYYLKRNEIMYENIDDTLGIHNRLYPKSEAALSFHVGVELAIDSLRRVGKHIVLHTFDTNYDSLQVFRLVNSNQLNSMDIIIGPMFSHLFQIVCKKYGDDADKILISPLSRENKGIIGYSSVYQIALTYKVQVEILSNYLINHNSLERIVIIHDKKEKRLALYSRNKFLNKNINVEIFEIDNPNINSLRECLVDSQNVLLLSREKTYISTILGAIGSIDSSTTLFSFESIMSYDNLDITNLMELDVHIPNSRSINPSNNFDSRFLLSFENEFQTNPGKYTKQGYDIIMHFVGYSKLYNFKKIPNGYYENISGPLFHYSDFELNIVQ